MARIVKLILLVIVCSILFSCGKKGPPTLKDYQAGVSLVKAGEVI